jgi:hypothetical protein
MGENVLERIADMFAGFVRGRSLGVGVPAVSAIADNKLFSGYQNGCLSTMEFHRLLRRAWPQTRVNAGERWRATCLDK